LIGEERSSLERRTRRGGQQAVIAGEEDRRRGSEEERRRGEESKSRYLGREAPRPEIIDLKTFLIRNHTFREGRPNLEI